MNELMAMMTRQLATACVEGSADLPRGTLTDLVAGPYHEIRDDITEAACLAYKQGFNRGSTLSGWLLKRGRDPSPEQIALFLVVVASSVQRVAAQWNWPQEHTDSQGPLIQSAAAFIAVNYSTGHGMGSSLKSVIGRWLGRSDED